MSRFGSGTLAAQGVIGLILTGTASMALAFPVTATLTGDLRPGNETINKIDVTIAKLDSNTVQWTVDLNLAGQPASAFLGDFYFNLTGLASNYSFYDFSPTSWTISSSPGNTQGMGTSTQFQFLAEDPPGSSNNVTNTAGSTLTFKMDVLSGLLTDSLFTGAGSVCSNDVSTWCGQLGAHVQGLNQGRSAFALGNYTTGGVPPGGNIPEPGSLGLIGAAMLGLYGALRRKPGI